MKPLVIVIVLPPTAVTDLRYGGLGGWVGVHLDTMLVRNIGYVTVDGGDWSEQAEGTGTRTFLFPPVIVTFTNRRVYVILFLARPLGVFFFSGGSIYSVMYYQRSDSDIFYLHEG